ncbi:MAG: hypothetical protein AAF607_03875 [Pseudomonadota bacterium]
MAKTGHNKPITKADLDAYYERIQDQKDKASGAGQTIAGINKEMQTLHGENFNKWAMNIAVQLRKMADDDKRRDRLRALIHISEIEDWQGQIYDMVDAAEAELEDA